MEIERIGISVPNDFSPSSQVIELLNSFKSLDDEQLLPLVSRKGCLTSVMG
jgi:hypothetical protein